MGTPRWEISFLTFSRDGETVNTLRKSWVFALLALVSTNAWAYDALYLPNLGGNATGTTSGAKKGLDVNIIGGSSAGAEYNEDSAHTSGDPGTFVLGVRNDAGTSLVSANGDYAPFSLDSSGALRVAATFSGGATETTLSALNAKFGALGQTTMTGSAPVVIASNQSAIPASQSGTWNITNVSGTVSLPTGAATAAKQPALGTAGTASADVITVQGIASMTALKVDGSAVTQPVSAASLPLPSGASTSALQTTGNTSLSSIDTSTSGLNAKFGSLGQKAMTGSAPVVLASDQSAIPVKLQDGSGSSVTKGQTTASGSLPVVLASDQGALSTKAPVSVTGSGSAAAATVSTVITLTAPANATGFILQNLDTSTANVRWAIGRTATATLGQQLQPGRDTGFVPCGANVSLVAESGTQNYDIQWVSQ
jgi:hypothetical protein